jgi:aconitate hydratase
MRLPARGLIVRYGRFVRTEVKEIQVKVNGREIVAILDVSDRDRQILLAGGKPNYVRHEGA